jgi:hypothetical protein
MADQYPKATQNKWQPQENDAIKLAALRWFALRAETEAIQVYATDSSLYEQIGKIMGTCIKQIHDLRKNLAGDDGDCPPGYVMCGTECAPICLNE